MKPGILSTEFWLCGIVVAVTFSIVLGIVPSERLEKAVGLATSMLTALGYTLARASVKKGHEEQGNKEQGLEEEENVPVNIVTAGPLKLEGRMAGELVLVPSEPMEAPRLAIDAPKEMMVEEILVGDDRIVVGPVKASDYRDGRTMPVIVTQDRPMKVVVQNKTDVAVVVQAGLIAEKGS